MLSSFVGRATEIEQITALILTHPFVTLTGSGGAGKTRLAFEVADGLRQEFADGVRVVELAALDDPLLVPQAVALALGRVESSGAAILDQLAAYLSERDLLVVLDNCEHLIDACASLVQALLQSDPPDLHILATSREPLGVPGEVTWRVPPLSTPQVSAQPAELPALTQFDAVRLFVERARLATPDFELLPGHASAVADICCGLDGMPLAIELAAARLKVLTVEQIAARLQDALGLLGGGLRGAAPRHRTMRATIDWSYQLLDEREAGVLRRLAVFNGGWELEAAEAVCGRAFSSRADLLDVLARLIDKSLVAARPHGGSMRYHMLEVLRQFAAEQLDAQREAQVVREDHLAYYLALAEQAKRGLRSPRLLDWLARLDQEHDNFRAALSFALERANDSERSEVGLRLASALEPFWRIRGHFGEGRSWLTAAVKASRATNVRSLSAQALADAANLAWFQVGQRDAQPIIEESLACWREVDKRDPLRTRGLANALRILGMARWSIADRAGARRALEESLSLFRALGDELGVADALWNIGAAAVGEDDATAQNLCTEALAIYEKEGDIFAAGRPRYQLANLHVRHKDLASARDLYERSHNESLALDNKYGILSALLGLGRVARLTGDLDAARTHFAEMIRFGQKIGLVSCDEYLGMAYVVLAEGRRQEAADYCRRSIKIAQQFDDVGAVAAGLIGLARIASEAGNHVAGARLLGAAEALCERAGATPYWYEQPDRDRCAEILNAALGTAGFKAGYTEGRSLNFGDAFQLGVNVVEHIAPTPNRHLTQLQAAKERYGGLTAREREVAAHVAGGKSNREIAELLVVSERTVEAHISNILSKLELISRTQIATWALQKGLAQPLRGHAE